MNDLEYEFDDSLSQNSDNAFQGNELVQSEDGTHNPEQNKENLTESDSDRHKSDKTKSPSKRHWQGERTGNTHFSKLAPYSTSGKNRKRKHVSDSEDLTSSSDEASECTTDSDNDAMFDPSSILDKTTKIPSKITKYVAKFATQGISKKCRLVITKNCAIPACKKLAPKSTDRFIKKLCRRKFGQPLSARKEMAIVNTQNRILDAVGPLAILWSEAQKVKS